MKAPPSPPVGTLLNYLYPITYNGRNWEEAECDSIYRSFFTCREAMRDDGSVYVGDGTSVYPDGTFTND